MSSRPRIHDDYEEEQEDDKYDNSESEDDLPTHEADQIEDGIIEFSTKIIKTDHKLKLKINKSMIMQ